jgi:hypothetical protein
MDCTSERQDDFSITTEEAVMTALLVLLLLFTALALASVRWGADTRVSGEWRWAEPNAQGRAGTDGLGSGGLGLRLRGPRGGGRGGPSRPSGRRSPAGAPDKAPVEFGTGRPSQHSGIPAPRPAPDPVADRPAVVTEPCGR